MPELPVVIGLARNQLLLNCSAQFSLNALGELTVAGLSGGLPVGGTLGQFLVKNSGVNYDAVWQTLNLLPVATKAHIAENEFYNTSFSDMPLTAVGSGTVVITTGTKEHPGVMNFKSSATNPSGQRFNAGALTLVLSGGEHIEYIYRPVTALANTNTYIGFFDVFTGAAMVDSAMFDINAGVCSAVCSSNSVQTIDGVTYTLTLNSWYRFIIDIAAAAASASFSIIDCATGVTVYTAVINTNIPNAVGRETGVGCMHLGTTGGVVTMAEADYFLFYINRTLVR
jgi:hypothetical protein